MPSMTAPFVSLLITAPPSAPLSALMTSTHGVVSNPPSLKSNVVSPVFSFVSAVTYVYWGFEAGSGKFIF